MTPAALRSEWVQAEVNAALNQVRKGRMLGVIPIVANVCDDADIPPLWDTLHRYDATHNYADALAGLLKALKLAVPTIQPATTPQSTLSPRDEAIRRRERRFELLATKQQLQQKLDKSDDRPRFGHFDAERETWKSKLAEVENLLLEDNGRWHPQQAVERGAGGAMEDYLSKWQFPCCGKWVLSDNWPSQYRIDGCESY